MMDPVLDHISLTDDNSDFETHLMMAVLLQWLAPLVQVNVIHQKCNLLKKCLLWLLILPVDRRAMLKGCR